MNFCDTYHARIVSHPRESSDAPDFRRARPSGDGGRAVEPCVTLGRITVDGGYCTAARVRRKENEDKAVFTVIKRQSTARSARFLDNIHGVQLSINIT